MKLALRRSQAKKQVDSRTPPAKLQWDKFEPVKSAPERSWSCRFKPERSQNFKNRSGSAAPPFHEIVMALDDGIQIGLGISHKLFRRGKKFLHFMRV